MCHHYFCIFGDDLIIYFIATTKLGLPIPTVCRATGCAKPAVWGRANSEATCLHAGPESLEG